MTCETNNNGKAEDDPAAIGNNNRYNVLCYEQVLRLHEFMEKEVTIHGRGHCCPSVRLSLRDMVQRVCKQLEASNIALRDLRLNGGGATFIIGMDSVHNYNDLDLLFGVDLSSPGTIEEIKRVVLDCLRSFLPEGSPAAAVAATAAPPTSSAVQQHHQQQLGRRRQYSSGGRHGQADPIDGYVRKLVRIQNNDSWYLISLGDSGAHQPDGVTVELKFVDRMRRKFEFTVDSFQIILDSLLTFYRIQPRPTAITEHFYPTVIAESVSGSFAEAYGHLVKKEICTRNPEEIRGGGLLKYCKLLVEGFLPAQGLDVVHLEKYMCSRFFIDFPDLRMQRAKMESYLTSHFPSDKDLELRAQYLQVLHEVVKSSTVCLMQQERRSTLYLISDLLGEIWLQIEARNNVIALEPFNSDNWVLDQVFYGTQYFPTHLAMASAAAAIAASNVSSPSGYGIDELGYSCIVSTSHGHVTYPSGSASVTLVASNSKSSVLSFSPPSMSPPLPPTCHDVSAAVIVPSVEAVVE